MEAANKYFEEQEERPELSWSEDSYFALHHAYRGDTAAVIGRLEEILSDVTRNGTNKYQSEYLLRSATALVRVGQMEQARFLVEEALTTYEATLGFSDRSAKRHLALFLNALEERSDEESKLWSRKFSGRTGLNSD